MRIFTSGAVLALLLGASVAHAAGLGKLTVTSGLGQILNAEIDLVSLQPGELDSLQARVASPEQFRDARIEYAPALRLLRFTVEKRVNGQPYLKVTSVAPINEPFVDLLIDVSWPAGRIQREYPILLDPPGYTQGKVAPPTVAASPPAASRESQTPPASAPAASSQTPASAEPSASSAAAPTAPGAAPSASAELTTPPGTPKETPASGDTYGPIQKGETLNKIATEVKPANVSLEQMLVALYRENQAAFIGNNMNRMKTGQILKVPSADDVAKIEQKDARQEIRTQVADWNSFRGQVAEAVPQMPARDTGNAQSGKVSTAAVTPPAPPPSPSSDVLKLSKSDAGGKAGAGKGGSGNQDRVNALQEEVTAKDKALKEANSRVADLEKQIQQMQRLLDLKGGAAAPGKADTKVATAPTPTPAPPKAEPPKPEPAKPAEPPKVAETKVAEPPKATPAPVEPPKTEAPKPAEPAKPAEPPKVADASKAAAKPAPKKAPPPPEKGFVDEALDNPLYLGIGGLAIAGILGAGAFLFLRRRKDRAEAGPSSSMTSAFPSDLKPEPSQGKAGGGLVDTGNSSFLTDFDKTGPGTIDTDEVDPVAEAEVYIAYGRDAQAEEILKEAMARDSGRTEIPLKLLEIYHARKSATAFETVAKELKSKVGEDSPAWQKAAAMGAQIDPNNPLYAGAAGYSAPAAAAAKPDVDFDIAGQSQQASPDFNLDAGLTNPKVDAETTNSPSGMDFDIHGGGAAPAPASEAPKSETPSSFDFDLSGLDAGGAKPGSGGSDLDVDPTQRPASSAASSGLNLTDLSLDMPGGDSGGGGGGGGEAVGTKLELAKAYLEIGDKDGAREILNEVAKEGSAEQKEEAQKLIASL